MIIKSHWLRRGGLLGCLMPLLTAPADEVRLWETNEVIPTYRAAPPDPNPRFYGGRTYQGARATFYPYPVQDRLTGVRTDQSYRVVYLENDQVRIGILPEIGGRVFSAVDKANGYDFFYRQHVIKPALIGMLGAWISGGVEWNVPHHHRASSFMPVDYSPEPRPDGSQTVWVGEIEWRHRMKWSVGLTLYPGRSDLEMTARVHNRTPFAHPLLFWINPAVHANEQYQVIFPPDVQFAVQHGKPEFARWPVATEVYGGVDYTRGVAVSWWKNHPSPVSFFAWNSAQDFFGGYDHGKQAGVLHVADHHQVPGKKFFEWGNGPEGEMWTKVLTDEDGPYLELMAGAWSDNQPDYSWIEPCAVKLWQHYWYPVRQLGGAKNATREAAVNLAVSNQTARVAFNATTEFRDAHVRLQHGSTALLSRTITISPREPFAAEVPLPPGAAETDLRASLTAADGREVVGYQPVAREPEPMPEPVKRPRPPKEITATEELYLTALRIEQLHSPAFEAAPYYEEALRRDPGDCRANTALGSLRCQEWRWPEAESHLRAAIERLTANYIRPKDTEAFYYLGVALRAQGKLAAAQDAFQRASWSPAWQAPADYQLAQLHCLASNLAPALATVDRSLAAAPLNSQARNLKTGLLRRLGHTRQAEELAHATLALDPLDFQARNELYLLDQKRDRALADQTLARLTRLLRDEPRAYLELAGEYANAGLWAEALDVLLRFVGGESTLREASPLVYYDLGYYAEMAGQIQSLKYYRLAARMSPDFCFPCRYEDEGVLRRALEWNPEDARAHYYLGNLLYDRQPERAIQAWETSRQLAETVPLVHRNLGLAYAQTRRDVPRAIASLEQAIALNPQEPRFFYELDLQYEAAGTPVAARLGMLTNHHDVVRQRDDALRRELALWVAAGQPDKALEVLTARQFHNWEGSGEIHGL